jgi:hypothetical protein
MSVIARSLAWIALHLLRFSTVSVGTIRGAEIVGDKRGPSCLFEQHSLDPAAQIARSSA